MGSVGFDSGVQIGFGSVGHAQACSPRGEQKPGAFVLYGLAAMAWPGAACCVWAAQRPAVHWGSCADAAACPAPCVLQGGPKRPFVQTFFLAVQEKGFYVMNDMFR